MTKIEPKFSAVVDVLKHHVDAGTLTVKQLEAWGDVEGRTIHYWLAGDRKGAKGPRIKTLALWLHRVPTEIGLHLLAAITSGTAYRVSSDGGPADHGGLMDEAVGAVQRGGDLLAVANAALADGRLTAAEREDVRARAIGLRQAAEAVIRATETPAQMRMRA